jgi:hypothetical protein
LTECVEERPAALHRETACAIVDADRALAVAVQEPPRDEEQDREPATDPGQYADSYEKVRH